MAWQDSHLLTPECPAARRIEVIDIGDAAPAGMMGDVAASNRSDLSISFTHGSIPRPCTSHPTISAEPQPASVTTPEVDFADRSGGPLRGGGRHARRLCEFKPKRCHEAARDWARVISKIEVYVVFATGAKECRDGLCRI
jgi:hypothetical protein